MNEMGTWAALIVVVGGPGSILTLWLRHKLRLNPETAEKVGGDGPKPLDYDQALIVLADRVEKQNGELTNLRVYLPQVIGWGHRGWAHVVPEAREPLPKPPDTAA